MANLVMVGTIALVLEEGHNHLKQAHIGQRGSDKCRARDRRSAANQNTAQASKNAEERSNKLISGGTKKNDVL